MYRFLIWTAIGQIFYFSYGFWHSKRRASARDLSVQHTLEPLSAVGSVAVQSVLTEVETSFVNEIAADDGENNFLSFL